MLKQDSRFKHQHYGFVPSGEGLFSLVFSHLQEKNELVMQSEIHKLRVSQPVHAVGSQYMSGVISKNPVRNSDTNYTMTT